jgi:hypothetical protein
VSKAARRALSVLGILSVTVFPSVSQGQVFRQSTGVPGGGMVLPPAPGVLPHNFNSISNGNLGPTALPSGTYAAPPAALPPPLQLPLSLVRQAAHLHRLSPPRPPSRLPLSSHHQIRTLHLHCLSLRSRSRRNPLSVRPCSRRWGGPGVTRSAIFPLRSARAARVPIVSSRARRTPAPARRAESRAASL